MVGELAHPGPYTIAGDRTLFDMISAAGGLSDKAGRVVTIIHRDDPDHKIELQLSPNLAEDTQNNVDILPGDTIIVSRAGIVYVVGDVQHPAGFMIEDNSLSVLKALALAGGSTRTSSLNKTRILRQTAERNSGNSGSIEEDPLREGAGYSAGQGRRFVCPRKLGQGCGLSHGGRGCDDDVGAGNCRGSSLSRSPGAGN